MERGMLWFDNNPKTSLMVKVTEAAKYYQQKYGIAPNLCFVHPSMLPTQSTQEGRITIRAFRPVLPGHLWIGIAEKN